MKTSQLAEVIQQGELTGMRSNQNPSISTNRSAGTKLGLSRMPVEWLDSGSWRLPSGKALAEFALQAGFLAPLLFRAERLGSATSRDANGRARSLETEAVSKHSGKGGNQ
jgi:hypothetical protein